MRCRLLPIAFAAFALAAEPPAPLADASGCPVCVVAPTKETVRHTCYGSKCEPFCLEPVSLRTFLRRLCGLECDVPCCAPPRQKARLLKWEVTEERERLKCVVEQCPPQTPPKRD